MDEAILTGRIERGEQVKRADSREDRSTQGLGDSSADKAADSVRRLVSSWL
jgi:hypothetical protein